MADPLPQAVQFRGQGSELDAERLDVLPLNEDEGSNRSGRRQQSAPDVPAGGVFSTTDLCLRCNRIADRQRYSTVPTCRSSGMPINSARGHKKELPHVTCSYAPCSHNVIGSIGADQEHLCKCLEKISIAEARNYQRGP